MRSIIADYFAHCKSYQGEHEWNVVDRRRGRGAGGGGGEGEGDSDVGRGWEGQRGSLSTDEIRALVAGAVVWGRGEGREGGGVLEINLAEMDLGDGDM